MKTKSIEFDGSPHSISSVCHLLRLPAELRNRIWQPLVHSPSYEIDPTLSTKTYPNVRYRIYGVERGVRAQQQPAVTKVCRQIRSEALSLYYSINTFMFATDSTAKGKRALEANRQKAAEWILSIGNHARHLRRVRLPMFVWVFYASKTVAVPLLFTCNVIGDPNSFGVSLSENCFPGVDYDRIGFTAYILHMQQVIMEFFQVNKGDDAVEKLWRALVLLARNTIHVDGKLTVSGDIIEHRWKHNEGGCKSNQKPLKKILRKKC